jgi:hypothetical protein
VTEATRETGPPGTGTEGDGARRARPSIDRVAALVFGLLIVGVAIEAVYELAVGPHPLADDWLHDTLIFGSAAMCAVGATAVVLGIGIAQIIASRPRSPHEVATPPATPGHGL